MKDKNLTTLPKEKLLWSNNFISIKGFDKLLFFSHKINRSRNIIVIGIPVINQIAFQ